ncbi:hypothetical protein BJV77DRAFT_1011270 [Russula vinacea]|nr:hypothetical protein BJV77DRAFT_1011270 [Russula vinacea]
MARRHRECAMAGSSPPLHHRKNLYISENSAQCIAPALQELVGGRVTDALPALESLFLEDFAPSRPVREAIEQFVAARQLLEIYHQRKGTTVDDLKKYAGYHLRTNLILLTDQVYQSHTYHRIASSISVSIRPRAYGPCTFVACPLLPWCTRTD